VIDSDGRPIEFDATVLTLPIVPVEQDSLLEARGSISTTDTLQEPDGGWELIVLAGGAE